MASQIGIDDYLIDDDAENQDLESFRRQWIEEMKKKNDAKTLGGGEDDDSKEHRADQLYLRGMRQENLGQMQQAVKLYREAIKCDDQVENRMIGSYDDVTATSSSNHHDNDDVTDEDDVLASKLSALNLNPTDNDEINLSNFPTEILVLIFRHVVSQHADLKSLASVAKTCRRFYLITRDRLLWKSIYERVYDHSPPSRLKKNGISALLKTRPFPRMDGIYMSKITYFREGDPTVMSQFYSPFQCVTYYRYIRFLSTGQILLVTTEDEPHSVVPKLASYKSGLQLAHLRTGKYHVKGDEKSAIVTTILRDYKPLIPASSSLSRHKNRRNQRSELKYIMTDAEFEIEWELTSRINERSIRRSNKLQWKRYICRYHFGMRSNQDTPVSESEVNLSDHYPPLYFHHVKSYHITSDGAV